MLGVELRSFAEQNKYLTSHLCQLFKSIFERQNIREKGREDYKILALFLENISGGTHYNCYSRTEVTTEAIIVTWHRDGLQNVG